MSFIVSLEYTDTLFIFTKRKIIKNPKEHRFCLQSNKIVFISTKLAFKKRDHFLQSGNISFLKPLWKMYRGESFDKDMKEKKFL